jgi:hypothetical protein
MKQYVAFCRDKAEPCLLGATIQGSALSLPQRTFYKSIVSPMAGNNNVFPASLNIFNVLS